LFTSVCATWPKEEGSLIGVKAVDEVLSSLSDEQLWMLLERCREWNVSARSAGIAQRVLSVLLKVVPAKRFTSLGRRRKIEKLEDGADDAAVEGPNVEKKKFVGRGGNIKELLEGLRVYTDRHYKRLEELIDESYLVDFTLREMDAIGGIANGGLLKDGRNVDGIANGEDVVMIG